MFYTFDVDTIQLHHPTVLLLQLVLFSLAYYVQKLASY